MNTKYYDLIFKGGIIAILAIWAGLITAAAIFISAVWLKIAVIVLLVLIPVVLFVVWIFKNYTGPQ